jgi:hypothetical protein
MNLDANWATFWPAKQLLIEKLSMIPKCKCLMGIEVIILLSKYNDFECQWLLNMAS